MEDNPILRVLRQRAWGLTTQCSSEGHDRPMATPDQWILKNTRRAFILLGWLATGQWTRAGQGLLPYYQRYVPIPVKKMIPRGLRAALNRRLSVTTSAFHVTAPAVVVSPAAEVSRVLLYTGDPLSSPPVRLIAFYLPQFHRIAENDAFWGDGFTDWTYVRTARPQFVGHYQPRVPGELGYYDLSDPKVQHRQVELAKLYGLGGFCFHFYWFNGNRPLEKPVENYLKDPTLDLPFCLCWANENWTRRWDGRDDEVLIAQHHSAADDLAFVEHISKYLRDPRYIRIDGKPLLVVYRPSLLPSAKATARRWREWCRSNGVGELYLAYTQSFERVDPAVYDFDAAVEFPPNMEAKGFELPSLRNSVKPIGSEFKCNVLDGSGCVARSRSYTTPGYRLFRGVCPGWDNTARRKNYSRILLNTSPKDYREWLLNAITDTCYRFPNRNERLVFVNAWNEWGEGAYLEPDARYGYAYLQATRDALRKDWTTPTSVFINRSVLEAVRCTPASKDLAVVLHLYYTDLWHETASYLENIHQPFDLFVSIPSDVSEETVLNISRKYPDAVVLAAENRGRDIAPFLELLAVLLQRGYTAALKIHTKRSAHRIDGDLWRQDLLNKLLGSGKLVEEISHCLKVRKDIGLIAPSAHLANLRSFIGSPDNVHHLENLGQRLGLSIDYTLSFCASSMFWFKPEALAALLRLRIDGTDFEPERGQIDGTLAHAVERFFGQVVAAGKYKIVTERSVLQGEYQDENPAGATDYEFTKRTERFPGEAGWVETRPSVSCNLCGATRFVSMNNRPNARCALCGSLERTRLLWLYLQKLGVPRPGSRVLHFAPEKGLYDAISRIVDTADYMVADIAPEVFPFAKNIVKFDICKAVETLPDNYFDLIVHAHVLEHIKCNISHALSHLHRALRPDGWHICVIPFLGGSYDECFGSMDPSEAKSRFGQFDHVRRFGRDDIDNSLGRILRFDRDFDATRDFAPEILRMYNIPETSWRGLSPDTVLCLRKHDMRLISAEEDVPSRQGNLKSQAPQSHLGQSDIMNGQTTAPLTWISPSEFELDGLQFTCDYTSHLSRPMNDQNVVIAKTRGLIDKLYEHLSPLRPQTMLEIGIAQGGSAFLHTSLFNLSKYVGVDMRPADAEVLTLLRQKYGPDRVRLYYKTSQEDKTRIARVCDDEFGGLCDVVIDDGSHQYELSVQTVEVALPHLRPGGLYVIEDWGWAHWQGDKWQDKKKGYNVGKPALSNLVFELTMLCASRPDIVDHAVVESGFAIFRKGNAKLDWHTFKLRESYLTQGRLFRTL